MFRRILPALLILIGVIVDTALLPMAGSSLLRVPVTLVFVLLIGMLLGRMRGLLYGTISGVLIDITAGTLGVMMAWFMITGFMIGLIVYQPEEHYVSDTRRMERRRRWVWPAIWTFVLYAAGEVALLVVQYFYTARFRWVYLLYLLARTLIFTVVVTLLRPMFSTMLLSSRPNTRRREVKNF